MKSFLWMLLLLAAPAFAQTKEARAGESVTLEIQISDPSDQINIYRKTGVSTTPALVATLPVLANVWKYEWIYVMPNGTTPWYRFFAVPKRGAELLEESNGVRVKRIK